MFDFVETLKISPDAARLVQFKACCTEDLNKNQSLLNSLEYIF